MRKFGLANNGGFSVPILGFVNYTVLGTPITVKKIIERIFEGLLILLALAFLAIFGIGFNMSGLPTDLLGWGRLIVSAFLLAFIAKAIQDKINIP